MRVSRNRSRRGRLRLSWLKTRHTCERVSFPAYGRRHMACEIARIGKIKLKSTSCSSENFRVARRADVYMYIYRKNEVSRTKNVYQSHRWSYTWVIRHGWLDQIGPLWKGTTRYATLWSSLYDSRINLDHSSASQLKQRKHVVCAWIYARMSCRDWGFDRIYECATKWKLVST